MNPCSRGHGRLRVYPHLSPRACKIKNDFSRAAKPSIHSQVDGKLPSPSTTRRAYIYARRIRTAGTHPCAHGHYVKPVRDTPDLWLIFWLRLADELWVSLP